MKTATVTFPKTVTVVFQSAPALKKMMAIHAIENEETLSKIWVEAGIMYLKSKGISVNIDTQDTENKEVTKKS